MMLLKRSTQMVLHNLVDKVFFTPMQENLSVDVKTEISEIKKKFYASVKSFSIEKGTLIQEYFYTVEGSINESEVYSQMLQLR